MNSISWFNLTLFGIYIYVFVCRSTLLTESNDRKRIVKHSIKRSKFNPLSRSIMKIYLYEMKKEPCLSVWKFSHFKCESLWINQANDWVNIQSITTLTRSICKNIWYCMHLHNKLCDWLAESMLPLPYSLYLHVLITAYLFIALHRHWQ